MSEENKVNITEYGKQYRKLRQKKTHKNERILNE